ncbi:MAG: cyclic nucleotide-binding domain-containing protein [Flavobacteriales bacterium]|nr:cyclic nucleotide-binding domain-containing protein [Flavobacteriales bacterium]
MEEIARRLGELGPMGAGERDALHQLRSIAEHIVLRKGADLFAYGEVPNSVAFVHAGMLRHMVLDTDGNERIIRFHREGEFVHDCERWAAKSRRISRCRPSRSAGSTLILPKRMR